MDEPKISQLPVMFATESEQQPIKNSQLVLLAISGTPDTPSNITQLPLLYLVNPARGVLTLKDPIALNCWQPCTQYGTYSTILYLGN